MSFPDDFTGTNGAFLDSRTGWNGSTSGSGAELLNNTLVASNGSQHYYWHTDQGSADQENYARFKNWDALHQNSYLAGRVVDASNFIGYKLHGTAAAGRRAVSVTAGTATPLGTDSQGVDEEFIKLKCDGNTITWYEGGTGGSPGTWNQIDTDTNSAHNTETSQGFSIGDAQGTIEWVDDYDGASLAVGGTTILPFRMRY